MLDPKSSSPTSYIPTGQRYNSLAMPTVGKPAAVSTSKPRIHTSHSDEESGPSFDLSGCELSEIWRLSNFRPHPCQRGAPPLQPIKSQAEPRRCTGWVARSHRDIRRNITVHSKAGSHSSYSTANSSLGACVGCRKKALKTLNLPMPFDTAFARGT
jgi:hypothetical protein